MLLAFGNIIHTNRSIIELDYKADRSRFGRRKCVEKQHHKRIIKRGIKTQV